MKRTRLPVSAYNALPDSLRGDVRTVGAALDAVGIEIFRQVQYETYFFGDPVRMAGAIFHSKDRTPYMERVREFLRSSSEEDG